MDKFGRKNQPGLKNDLQKEYEEYLAKEGVPSHKISSLNKKRLGGFWKAFFISLISLVFVFSAYAGFVFLRLHSAYNKMSDSKADSTTTIRQGLKSATLSLIPSQRKELRGEEDGRINILLLGAAGEKKPGKNLTDTIMIASIDIKLKKIALLSLPRDMYVKIPNTDSFTKINGLYQYGTRNDLGADIARRAVEEITSLPIHYHLVVDFDGFVKFVDTLDGINVEVERDIYDTRYPGPNYSYQTFELKKGLQRLDGETALKYVRERHDDPLGDFGRAKRQQQVMQAIKNKSFSLKTILNPVKINEVLKNLEHNVRTDLALDEIESLLVLSRELDTQNITTRVVDAWNKNSLLKVSHVFYEDIRAFVLVPRAGNYSQIHELAQEIFNIEKIEKRKAEIVKENSSVAMINLSGDSSLPKKIEDLLSENIGIKNITLLEKPGNSLKEKETLVIDLSAKQKIFTLDEIIKSVPAKLSEKNDYPDLNKYDFVLILGEDIIKSYEFEEDDVEEFKNSNEAEEYFEITD